MAVGVGGATGLESLQRLEEPRKFGWHDARPVVGHLCIQMGRAEGYGSFHMVDAGEAVTAAVKAPPGVFNIVDDKPLTKREYADALAQAAQTRPWLRLPGRAALLLVDRSTSLTRSLRVSNARFRTAATHWKPQYASACEGWIATVAALSEHTGRALER